MSLGVILLALFPASAGMLLSEEHQVAYYLHSTSPAGNVEMATSGRAGAASMDATVPTAPVSKAAVVNGIGAHDIRKNALTAYWAGNATGEVRDMRAEVWLASARPAIVVATVFGDGAAGSIGPLAYAKQGVNFTSGRQVVFDFGAARGNVHGELVLQLTVETLDGHVVALYDAAATPSRFLFTLGPLAAEPPLARAPAPGWDAVTLVNATSAALETSLAIDPGNASRLFLCSPSGLGNTARGQSYFHKSEDGGASWRLLSVETGSTDPRRFTFEGGDCDVAFDAIGTMYSADTWLGSLSVGASVDGGEHWTGTPLAATAPVVDRPWLVGGGAGVVHVTWQDLQFGMPSAIWYARSTDFGLTFSAPTSVATANAQGAFTWTGNFVVSPDGIHLYSVHTRRQGPNMGLDNNGPETVWVAASHDRGVTWTSNLVATMPGPASFLYPSIARDAAGQLHVVFSSKSATDRPIWYVRSTDHANTWSAPIKLLANASGWAPWVDARAPGQAVVQWYGTKTPQGSTQSYEDWYFFAARVNNGTVTSAGATTTTPIFQGVQGSLPEFNQVRLDRDGRTHVGASAFLRTDAGTGWALWHQASSP